MRVTQSMMINNMSYWTAQQAERLQDAQTVVASGKKINKPSDDPLAVEKILSDRVSLSQYGQYESNIAQAKTWIDSSSSTLNAVYATLQNAHNTASAAGDELAELESPTGATASINPAMNLDGRATATSFSTTINVYDSDLKAIPLTINFTKVDATHWDWAAAIPAEKGTVTAGLGSDHGTLTFTAAGQLDQGAGAGAWANPSISLALTNGATTPQVVTWDLYNGTATNGDLTQYAAPSGRVADTSISSILLTSFYDQILSLANSPYATGYMYSGNLSNTMPFADKVNISSTVVSPIIFDMAETATTANIEVINSTGTVVRHITLQPPPAFVIGTKTIQYTWDGHNDSGANLDPGQYSFTVKAYNTTEPVATYATYRGDTGDKEILTGVNERVALNNNGKDIFSNILSNLSKTITAINAISAIRANTPLDSTALATAKSTLSDLSAALQRSITELEAKQVELANASVQFDMYSTRLQQQTTNASNRISDLEIGSKEEAAIKYQVQQTNYEQVLSVTANILKMPKLSDYI